MCGEHSLSPYTSRIGAGSSPHVRGARRIECECDWIIGIIPACAGSTLTLAVSKNRARDHPRMCGEHIVWPSSLTMAGGSSPHVRGARSNGSGKTLCMGIIPACAGSTSSVSSSPRPMRDHPRMCGEHQRKNALHGARHGSSPHVRGALRLQWRGAPSVGIIPACAGSTGHFPHKVSGSQDHPRMCGEHACLESIVWHHVGSSPHVRGARIKTSFRHIGVGIIPACAGSTLLARWDVRWIWDHPRMCGEHTSKIA